MNRPPRLAPLCCVLLSALSLFSGDRCAAAAEAPLVYRCTTASGVAYADRPCAAAGFESEQAGFHLYPERQNRYAPRADDSSAAEAVDVAMPPGKRGAAELRARAKPRSKSSTPREQRRLRCDALQRRIDRVNSLMRAGYHGARGERLRAQWSDLKTRYYDEKCLGAH